MIENAAEVFLRQQGTATYLPSFKHVGMPNSRTRLRVNRRKFFQNPSRNLNSKTQHSNSMQDSDPCGKGTLSSIVQMVEGIDHALTADELARLLSVSKVVIYKYASEGTIPSFKIGTLVRFDAAQIAAWLKSKTESSGAKRRAMAAGTPKWKGR